MSRSKQMPAVQGHGSGSSAYLTRDQCTRSPTFVRTCIRGSRWVHLSRVQGMRRTNQGCRDEEQVEGTPEDHWAEEEAHHE
eukprot:750163-Hanusia_phi.AAC.10